MERGLYIAASGVVAEQMRQDQIANDLANASTPGYKHVRIGFRDLLYSQQGGDAGETVMAGAGSAADFIGRGQAQGALQTTGQPLDVAIQDPGWFQVKRPDAGERDRVPQRLIGLESRRFTLVARDADADFLWLHSIDDPSLALPVTDPRRFFSDFELQLGEGERERLRARS